MTWYMTNTEPFHLASFIQAVHETARSKGWWEPNGNMESKDPRSETINIPEKLALIHAEISEALEAYRDDAGLHEILENASGKPDGFIVELADAVIRIFDLVAYMGEGHLLIEALKRKHAYNNTRPHRHGGKKC